MSDYNINNAATGGKGAQSLLDGSPWTRKTTKRGHPWEQSPWASHLKGNWVIEIVFGHRFTAWPSAAGLLLRAAAAPAMLLSDAAVTGI